MDWKIEGHMYQRTAKAKVDGLGEVYIHWDNGWAVDINGKRVWSGWKGSLDNKMLDIQREIKAWEYLNSFKT